MKARHCAMMLLAVGSTLAATGATFAQTDLRPGTGKLTIPRVTGPARDSRGTLVISDPAEIPRGANEPIGSQVNRDPRVVFAPRASNEVYKICSKEVTDNCIQVWEPPKELPNCPGDPDCPT